VIPPAPSPHSPESKSGDFFLACFNALKPTGWGGAEGLVAKLLEAWTGRRFRLARSGAQAGRDGSSMEPGRGGYAIEVKRYAGGQALNTRELRSELSEVGEDALHIDAWILVTSTEVAETQARTLTKAASDSLIEIVIIDDRTIGLGRLRVLAARHPEVCADHLSGNLVGLDEAHLRRSLAAVVGDPTFAAEEEDLSSLLRCLMPGLDAATDLSHQWLKNQLSKANSRPVFAQDVGVRAERRAPLVPRTAVLRSLDEWWLNAAVDPIRILSGEEGMGKTWAALDWVLRRIETDPGFPMALLFTSNLLGTFDPEEPASLVEAALRRIPALKSMERRLLQKRCSHWIENGPSQAPVVLLILDGLNERPSVEWSRLFERLEAEDIANRVAVLATARPGYLRHALDASWDDCCTIVPRYDDDELAVAAHDLQPFQRSDDLQGLLRIPRYCELALRNKDALLECGDLTAARLYYEDAKNTWQHRQVGPWKNDDFSETLIKLAKEYRVTLREEFDRSDLARLLPASIGSGADRALEDLASGSVFHNNPDPTAPQLVVDLKRLSYALGLLLWRDARSLGPGSVEDAYDQVCHWLEPHSDTDFKAEVCGIAVFFASMAENPPEFARRALLRHWLGSRNMSAEVEDAARAYVVKFPAEYLQLVEVFWSTRDDNEAAQGRIAAALRAHRAHPNLAQLLHRDMVTWLSVVHHDGDPEDRWIETQEGAPKLERLEDRLGYLPPVGALSVAQWTLRVVDDVGLVRLPRLAALLLSEMDREPFTNALAARAIGCALMGDRIGGAQEGWLLRLSPDNPEAACVGEARQMAERPELFMKRAAHRLLYWCGTSEALQLARDLKDKHFPSDQAWFVATSKNGLAWPRERVEEWSRDLEVSVDRLAERVAIHAVDPALELPPPRVSELEKWIDDQDSKYLGTSRAWNTIEEYRLNEVEPTLARFAPRSMAARVRRIVHTIPLAGPEDRQALACSLDELLPLLGREERVRIEEVRRTLPSLEVELEDARRTGFIGNARQTEYHTFLAWLASAPIPLAQLEALLGRSPAAFDALVFGHWFRRLSEEEAELAWRDLATAEGPRLRRQLWFLGHQAGAPPAPQLEIIRGFIASDSESLRARALRFVSMTENRDLARNVVSGARQYSSCSDREEDRCGGWVLAHLSEADDEENIWDRLDLYGKANFVAALGSKERLVQRYLASLQSDLRLVAEASPVVANRLPDVKVGVRSEEPDGVVREYGRDPNRSISFVSADSTWRTRHADPELMEDFRDPDRAETSWKRRNAAMQLLAEACLRVPSSWYHLPFRADVLKAAGRIDIGAIRQLASMTLEALRRGRPVMRLSQGFCFALTEALLDGIDPVLGVELWRASAEDIGRAWHGHLDAEIQWHTLVLFRSTSSPGLDDLRIARLRSCTSDIALLDLATSALLEGRGDWIAEQCRRMAAEPRAWRRAQGLALLAFADVTTEEWDDAYSASRLEGTFLTWSHGNLRSHVERNAWAKHWYGEFFGRVDADLSWAAFRLFLRCVDKRFFAWVRMVEDRAQPAATVAEERRRFVRTAMPSIGRAMKENQKDLERRFLSIRFEEGGIAPWIDDGDFAAKE
jgi:hypothetical protein